MRYTQWKFLFQYCPRPAFTSNIVIHFLFISVNTSHTEENISKISQIFHIARKKKFHLSDNTLFLEK